MPPINVRMNEEVAQAATNNLGALCQTLLDHQRELQAAMLSGDWSKVAQLQMQRQTELLTIWTQAVTSMAGPMGASWRDGMVNAIQNWQKAANVAATNMAEQGGQTIETMRPKARQ